MRFRFRAVDIGLGRQTNPSTFSPKARKHRLMRPRGKHRRASEAFAWCGCRVGRCHPHPQASGDKPPCESHQSIAAKFHAARRNETLVLWTSTLPPEDSCEGSSSGRRPAGGRCISPRARTSAENRPSGTTALRARRTAAMARQRPGPDPGAEVEVSVASGCPPHPSSTAAPSTRIPHTRPRSGQGCLAEQCSKANVQALSACHAHRDCRARDVDGSLQQPPRLVGRSVAELPIR
mmetsp:Transcript_23271/g.55273  ORF Transcript_23271/g.55273 Transcript_23271/m.55273 type:complete len:235 (-) Transcript_23271:278-982(-)